MRYLHDRMGRPIPDEEVLYDPNVEQRYGPASRERMRELDEKLRRALAERKKSVDQQARRMLVVPLDGLFKADHVSPANARPTRLPLADPVVEADVQHTSWAMVRQAIAAGAEMRLLEQTVTASFDPETSKLWATQAVVDRKRVEHDAAKYREHGQDPDELPLVIERDGLYYILAGHHHSEGVIEACDGGPVELRVQRMAGIESAE